jgi:hypothetical protein
MAVDPMPSSRCPAGNAHRRTLTGGWELTRLGGDRLRVTNRTGGTAETVALVLAETQEVVATSEFLSHGAALDFGTSRPGAVAITWVDTTSGQLRVRLL